jgi:hypothetical protein
VRFRMRDAPPYRGFLSYTLDLATYSTAVV